MELFLIKFIMFMLIILGVFAGGYYVGKNEKQNNFLLNCSFLCFSFYSRNLVSLSIFKIYIMKDEIISAFAFNVGRQLEKLVAERNENLSEQLDSLQVSVFKFREELQKSGNTNMLKYYDTVFGIKEVR